MANEQQAPATQEQQVPQLNKLEAHQQIQRSKRVKIIMLIIIIIMLLLSVWGIIQMGIEENSFKIIVSGERPNAVLSLSFDSDFSDGGFSVIRGLGSETSNQEGCSYAEDVKDLVDGLIDGTVNIKTEDNGQAGRVENTGNDEFTASRFYLKYKATEYNNQPIKVSMRINVTQNSKNALAAARFYFVKDFDNGNAEYHAIALEKNGGGNELFATTAKGSDTYVKEPGTNTDWVCENLKQDTDGTYYYEEVLTMSAGDVIGYCTAVWFEGSDPDHNDAIIGGYISFDITFTVVD